MAVVADQVIVELIARIDQYARDFNRADQISSRTFRNIETGASRTARGVSQAVGIMRSALAGLGTAFSVQAFVQLTSAWTDLNSRVQNAVGGIERADAVMSQLQVIARRTYSSLNQTAESFLQNSQALNALGYSTQQQLDLSETLNNALVISAVRGDRVRQIQDAWSKAMAAGTLRGENLNTVIQVGGRLSQALADSLGVSVNELRSLGEQGKITTDAMYGVTSQLQQLREEAEAMPATVSDGFVLLNNAIMTFVGEADAAAGSSAALAESIVGIADAINNAPQERWFDDLFQAIGDDFARGLENTRKEIEAIGNALEYFQNTRTDEFFRDLFDPSFVTDYERTAIDALTNVEDAFRDAANAALSATGGEVREALDEIVQGINNETLAADEAAKKLIELAAANPEEEPLVTTLRAWTESLYAVRDGALAAAQGMSDIGGALPTFRQFQRIFGPDLSNDGNPDATRPTPRSTGKSPEQRFDEALEAQRRRNEELQQETALRATLNPLVNDYGYAIEKLRIQQQLENDAARAGLELTPERVAAISALAETYATATVAAARLDEEQKNLKASAEAWASTIQEATRSFIDDLIEGKSAAEAFSNVLSNIANQLLDVGLSNLFGTGGFNLGGLFGGTSTRATGGPVYAGNPTLVGERGPEVFIPSGPGRIVPNSQIGGGGNITFAPVIDARGADVAAVARLERAVQSVAADVIPAIRREMATANKKGRPRG